MPSGTSPPSRARERGGGVKSDGSRHTLACLGSHWWFRVFCSHERAISSQLRLRCRGASRVRLVVRHTRHRRAVALWHLPTLASVGEEPNQAVATEHSGLLGLALVVSCLSTPRMCEKSPITEPDVVIHHACGRWAATRAIGGHVSSGTSRPSRASFGRSQIVAHMGLFGLALVVPCLLRSKNCESRELRRRSRGFSGVRSVLGAATHAAGGQVQSSGISGTLVSAWEEPYRTVAAVHTGLVGLKSPVATPMPWFTTRAVGEPPPAIGGHVPSGTSRPSSARVRSGGAKSEIGRQPRRTWGGFGLALMVLCLSTP